MPFCLYWTKQWVASKTRDAMTRVVIFSFQFRVLKLWYLLKYQFYSYSIQKLILIYREFLSVRRMRRFPFDRFMCACVVLDKWRFILKRQFYYLYCLKKTLFHFWEKTFFLILLGFYGVVKTIVSFKMVLTLPSCICSALSRRGSR